MKIITEQGALEAFCAEAAAHPYVAVDFEFLRERTYWAELCLIQMAFPGPEEEAAAIIDPIAGDLDLAPLFALMKNQAVVKVFHAGRQDIEILHHLGRAIPQPLFDTQVAASVLGYGDQAGYEALVRRIAKRKLDKSARVTDWSRRPLTDRQLAYALADVTHLRAIYEKLSHRLEETSRRDWVAEEMALLSDPDTYETDPEEAWRRVRARSDHPRFLAALRALAAWREREAQSRDVPRGRLMKDDALLEIASARPADRDELSRLRMVQREARKPETAEAILAVLAEAETAEPPEAPAPRAGRDLKPAQIGVLELLKVLLKARSETAGVAQRLIGSTADLEALAQGETEGLKPLLGWRAEVFGAEALRLTRGEIALSAGPRGVVVISLDPEASA